MKYGQVGDKVNFPAGGRLLAIRIVDNGYRRHMPEAVSEHLRRRLAHLGNLNRRARREKAIGKCTVAGPQFENSASTAFIYDFPHDSLELVHNHRSDRKVLDMGGASRIVMPGTVQSLLQLLHRRHPNPNHLQYICGQLWSDASDLNARSRRIVLDATDSPAPTLPRRPDRWPAAVTLRV